MSSSSRTTSLFDDIFQLQTTVPDIDPEDSDDGLKTALTEGATEVEVLGSTQLRKQAAIIPDDPKYKGKKVSRKTLYSDGEEEESDVSDSDEDLEGSYEVDNEEGDDDVTDNTDDERDISEDEDVGDDQQEAGIMEGEKDGSVVVPSDANDREKGKAVSHQLELWDDMIKCRISLQKIISSCNRLPTPDLWGRFAAFPSFQKESSDALSSVRQVLSSLLDLQQELTSWLPNQGKSILEGSDEEITSESEAEDEKDDTKVKDKEEDVDNDEEEDGDVKEEEVEDKKDEEEDMDYDDDEEDGDEKEESGNEVKKDGTTKRKLDQAVAEETLAKRHKDFQSFRNSTLDKWDEKTRLSQTKIKSKNFSAFDISVLKQIQQVLGNKDRLIRRIHQNRSSLRILGQSSKEEDISPKEMVVEDDEDEVEVKQRSIRPETDVNYEIVDDSDFYQMCLRDFIQLKQNEETDPVLANRHWLEIQNMRKKHKRKVDTRASKGRKIRYHVKQKLKNFMAPYDKSTWNEEQKDDLFKSLFGGRQDINGDHSRKGEDEPLTINIGL